MASPKVIVEVPGNPDWQFFLIGENWIPAKLEKESLHKITINYLEEALKAAKEMYG